MNRRQTIPAHLRYTINDFNRQFPDDDACFEHLREQRFPGGIAYCAVCREKRQHHRVKGRPVYACDECLTQISPMAGTIFEHSSTSLRLWYYAMYLMASTRCGISAKQIQRETGVTYKTAWRMFRQVRSLLSETDMQLEGSAVEVDEMYVGGKRKGGAGRPMRGDKVKRQCSEWWSAKGASLLSLFPTRRLRLCAEQSANMCFPRAPFSQMNWPLTTLSRRDGATSISASITVPKFMSWATFTRIRLKDSGV